MLDANVGNILTLQRVFRAIIALEGQQISETHQKRLRALLKKPKADAALCRELYNSLLTEACTLSEVLQEESVARILIGAALLHHKQHYVNMHFGRQIDAVLSALKTGTGEDLSKTSEALKKATEEGLRLVAHRNMMLSSDEEE